VSDKKGNKVSGRGVHLTDEQRIDWLQMGFEMAAEIRVLPQSCRA
jgi:hypothetical protein